MRLLVEGDEPRSPAADLGFTILRTAVGLMMAFGHGLAAGGSTPCRGGGSTPRPSAMPEF